MSLVDIDTPTEQDLEEHQLKRDQVDRDALQVFKEKVLQRLDVIQCESTNTRKELNDTMRALILARRRLLEMFLAHKDKVQIRKSFATWRLEANKKQWLDRLTRERIKKPAQKTKEEGETKKQEKAKIDTKHKKHDTKQLESLKKAHEEALKSNKEAIDAFAERENEHREEITKLNETIRLMLKPTSFDSPRARSISDSGAIEPISSGILNVSERVKDFAASSLQLSASCEYLEDHLQKQNLDAHEKEESVQNLRTLRHLIHVCQENVRKGVVTQVTSPNRVSPPRNIASPRGGSPSPRKNRVPRQPIFQDLQVAQQEKAKSEDQSEVIKLRKQIKKLENDKAKWKALCVHYETSFGVVKMKGDRNTPVLQVIISPGSPTKEAGTSTTPEK
jgi:hypothetical protein